MSDSREIKCPECGRWTLWNGNLNDRCLYCNSFLDKETFSRMIEKEISRQVRKEKDWLIIRPSDSPFKRRSKQILLSFKGAFHFAQIAFLVFISFLMWLISLLAF